MLLWNKKRKKRVVKNAMAVCVALQPLQLEVQAELQVHCDVADKRHLPSLYLRALKQMMSMNALKRVPSCYPPYPPCTPTYSTHEIPQIRGAGFAYSTLKRSPFHTCFLQQVPPFPEHPAHILKYHKVLF